jgi:hypothetical protein
MSVGIFRKLFFVLFAAFIGLNSQTQCLGNEADFTNPVIYLKDRIKEHDKRYDSFFIVLELLNQKNAKILLETGTARCGESNFIGDGGSTVIFGHWARDHSSNLYSVDIDPRAVVEAQRATQEYSEFVNITCCDSVEFLEKFDKPVDFVYLDSYDFDESNPCPSQNHHLREIIAIYPMLHENSIVMIDDCGLPHGGKCSLVIPYLLERGWKIYDLRYQVILVRDDTVGN